MDRREIIFVEVYIDFECRSDVPGAPIAILSNLLLGCAARTMSLYCYSHRPPFYYRFAAKTGALLTVRAVSTRTKYGG
jgi:hypothetical protein